MHVTLGWPTPHVSLPFVCMIGFGYFFQVPLRSDRKGNTNLVMFAGILVISSVEHGILEGSSLILYIGANNGWVADVEGVPRSVGSMG